MHSTSQEGGHNTDAAGRRRIQLPDGMQRQSQYDKISSNTRAIDDTIERLIVDACSTGDSAVPEILNWRADKDESEEECQSVEQNELHRRPRRDSNIFSARLTEDAEVHRQDDELGKGEGGDVEHLFDVDAMRHFGKLSLDFWGKKRGSVNNEGPVSHVAGTDTQSHVG